MRNSIAAQTRAAALGGRRRSPFAQLVPKMAESLRANGCAHVETAIIRGAVHYVVEDQPDAVADLIVNSSTPAVSTIYLF
jgi:hypothetical protein